MSAQASAQAAAEFMERVLGKMRKCNNPIEVQGRLVDEIATLFSSVCFDLLREEDDPDPYTKALVARFRDAPHDSDDGGAWASETLRIAAKAVEAIVPYERDP